MVAPAGQPEPAWPPATGAPRYDYGLIARLEALIAESETGWRQLYNELGLTPNQVVYEELSSPDGYEQTIRACWLISASMTTEARSQLPGRAVNPTT